MNSSPLQVALIFVDAINEHDPEAIVKLMTDDHEFVDAIGNIYSGKETMLEAWKNYFKTFPDYKIAIKNKFAARDEVMFGGDISGCHNGVRSEETCFFLPAAFMAVINGEKVRLWQVFADTKKQFDVIK